MKEKYSQAFEFIKQNECQLAADLFFLGDEKNAKELLSYFKDHEPPLSLMPEESTNNHSSSKKKHFPRKKESEFKVISQESRESVKTAYDEILLKKNKIIFIEKLIEGAIKNSHSEFFWDLVCFLAKSFSDYFLLIENFKKNILFKAPIFSSFYFQEISLELIGFFEKRIEFLIGFKNHLSLDQSENKDLNGEALCEIYQNVAGFYFYCCNLSYISTVSEMKEFALLLIEKSQKHKGTEQDFSSQLEETIEEIKKNIETNPCQNVLNFKEILENKINSKIFSSDWIGKIKKRKAISEEDFLDVSLFFDLFIKNDLPKALSKKVKFIFIVLFDFFNQTKIDVDFSPSGTASFIKKAFFLDILNLKSISDKLMSDFFFSKKDSMKSLFYDEKMALIAGEFKKEKAARQEDKLLNEIRSEKKRAPLNKNIEKPVKKKKAKNKKPFQADKKISDQSVGDAQVFTLLEKEMKEIKKTPQLQENKKKKKKKKKKKRVKKQKDVLNQPPMNLELTDPNETVSLEPEVATEIQPLMPPVQWHVTAYTIPLSEGLEFVFKELKKLNDFFKLYCFGGYVRDKIQERTYVDFDILMVTNLHADEVFSLLKSCAFFLNCRVSKRKNNLITAEFKWAGKNISIDISVQEKLDFSPFLDTHAFCVDERGFLWDRSVLNQYSSLDEYRNREIILPLYPKAQLIEEFKKDPIKMIKAIKDSAKIEKNLHQDIIEAVKGEKKELTKLSWSQILSPLTSISYDSSHLERFLKECKKHKLIKYVFLGADLKNLNSETLNWVSQVSIAMKNLGCTSPHGFLIAPLLIVSFYQSEMQKKEFRENNKYIFYFSLHCAFYFFKRRKFQGSENRSVDHLTTFKHWFSDLFLGLFLILTHLRKFKVECLKNSRPYQGFLKLNEENIGENFFVSSPAKLIDFDFFSCSIFNVKPLKIEQGKISPEMTGSVNDRVFILIRMLFAIQRNSLGVENFEKNCEAVMNLNSFVRNSVVEKIGLLIVYLINYPLNDLEMILSNFDQRFNQKNRPLERSISLYDFNCSPNYSGLLYKPSPALFKPFRILNIEVRKNRENISVLNYSKVI